MYDPLYPSVQEPLTDLLERMAVAGDKITDEFSARLRGGERSCGVESSESNAIQTLGAHLSERGVAEEAVHLVRHLIQAVMSGPLLILDGATESASSLRVMLRNEAGELAYPDLVSAWWGHLAKTGRADYD